MPSFSSLLLPGGRAQTKDGDTAAGAGPGLSAFARSASAREPPAVFESRNCPIGGGTARLHAEARLRCVGTKTDTQHERSFEDCLAVLRGGLPAPAWAARGPPAKSGAPPPVVRSFSSSQTRSSVTGAAQQQQQTPCFERVVAQSVDEPDNSYSPPSDAGEEDKTSSSSSEEEFVPAPVPLVVWKQLRTKAIPSLEQADAEHKSTEDENEQTGFSSVDLSSSSSGNVQSEEGAAVEEQYFCPLPPCYYELIRAQIGVVKSRDVMDPLRVSARQQLWETLQTIRDKNEEIEAANWQLCDEYATLTQDTQEFRFPGRDLGRTGLFVFTKICCTCISMYGDIFSCKLFCVVGDLFGRRHVVQS